MSEFDILPTDQIFAPVESKLEDRELQEEPLKTKQEEE